IAHPTDSRLLDKSRQHLVKVAKDNGLRLRQNYNRVAPRLAAQIGRYAHAKQFKRMKKALRTLRTRVGRVHREVDRQLYTLPEAAKAKVQELLQRTSRILTQRTKDKNKLYSLSKQSFSVDPVTYSSQSEAVLANATDGSAAFSVSRAREPTSRLLTPSGHWSWRPWGVRTSALRAAPAADLAFAIWRPSMRLLSLHSRPTAVVAAAALSGRSAAVAAYRPLTLNSRSRSYCCQPGRPLDCESMMNRSVAPPVWKIQQTTLRLILVRTRHSCGDRGITRLPTPRLILGLRQRAIEVPQLGSEHMIHLAKASAKLTHIAGID
ncbi:hypothetical protein AX018_10531, partial [Paracidovorax anthurii]